MKRDGDIFDINDVLKAFGFPFGAVTEGKVAKEEWELEVDYDNAMMDLRHATAKLIGECSKCGNSYCMACGGYYTVRDGLCTCNALESEKLHEHNSYWCLKEIKKQKDEYTESLFKGSEER